MKSFRLYTSPLFKTRVKQPNLDLKDFQRVELAPKETKTVTFKLKQTDLAFWDVTRETFAVERGPYRISVGRLGGGHPQDKADLRPRRNNSGTELAPKDKR